MEYIAEIQADISGYPGMQKLIMKQGDMNTRYVLVTLLDNGVQIFPGEDESVFIAMTKPDGRQVLVDQGIEVMDSGQIRFEIWPQMSTAAGCGRLEIDMRKGGALLTTSVVDVYIYPSAYSIAVLTSSDEYQALIDALAQIAPAIDAEKERIANEIIRQEQEAIRQEALVICREVTAYAKEQGDYAKEQGDHAKTQGDRASAVTDTCIARTEECVSATKKSETQTKVCEKATQLAIEAAAGSTLVYDPADGQKKMVQDTLDNMWSRLVQMFGSPITVDEFDALNLTVNGFDTKKITVNEFDTRAKAILGGN